MPGTRALLRYARISPPKVREVLSLIRGLDVGAARERLELCERGPADDVLKLLDSAVANAEHDHNLPEDELFIARAYADDGPILKRWRPRARGRGVRIRKRTSHVTIVLERFAEEELERRRRTDVTRPAARRQVRRRRVREAEQEPGAEHDHTEETGEGVAEAETESRATQESPSPAKARAPATKKVPATKKTPPRKRSSAGGSDERSVSGAPDPEERKAED
jgi:large subunit ribosomal protein L22